MNRTKQHAAFLIALTVIVLGQGIHSSAADDTETKATANHANVHVQSLLKKRLDVLQQIVKLRRAAYLHGEAGLNAVLRSEVDVLEAKLELATQPDERVAVRKETLKQSRELEAAAKKLVEAKQASAVDMLRAKAFRLRCEADLLREQSAAHDHHHHVDDHKDPSHEKGGVPK